MKTFLHVGCGPQYKSQIKGFDNESWKEIRFDIDEKVNPDIVGTLLDMSAVEAESVDAIYSSHNIEHVFPHEVPIVLREFHRVLKDDGMVVLRCPDLQSVCEAVVDDKLLQPLYESPAGPISPIDILYGYRPAIARGNEYMAHKGGFTYSVLNDAFIEAGFKMNYGGRNPDRWELFIISFKREKLQEEINTIAKPFLKNFI
ncbi:MAG: methyltransferase domain-containing protein [Gammaproteobacteria bacterium]|nr:methyltransferase domain-containing protein [Gammaproteobacteria bacterium]